VTRAAYWSGDHGVVYPREAIALADAQKSWTERYRDLAALAGRQLFFVGGAPRSGTTWLQLLLDSHPEVSCRGEGLFWKALAEPLDRLLVERRAALDAK
jgi:hypothetical protein